MRPQRASRAISTIGAKVQCRPAAEASRAATSASLAGQLRFPTAGFGQRDGEDGAVAVDHIQPKDERNAQARLLDGDLLQAVDLIQALHAQVRADCAFVDPIFVEIALSIFEHFRVRIFHKGGEIKAADNRWSKLGELAGFFEQGHLRQQTVNFGFDLRVDELGLFCLHCVYPCSGAFSKIRGMKFGFAFLTINRQTIPKRVRPGQKTNGATGL